MDKIHNFQKDSGDFLSLFWTHDSSRVYCVSAEPFQ